MYSYEEIMSYVDEEDVKFVRLTFCDLDGTPKNISIQPGELKRAFTDGVSFDASAIRGFSDEVRTDLFLHPDPSTLSILPWRPSHGRVVRIFCDIRYPDGKRCEKDVRYILQKAIAAAKEKGLTFRFGSEFEFYLFRAGEDGGRTEIPFDQAGLMDIAPEDAGENVRREICFNLLDMGIQPESSCHKNGPGQNEIDFRYSDALSAADNAVTFKAVVKTVAQRNGLWADFSPKPLANESGNGMHINMSVQSADGKDLTDAAVAGILSHIREMTAYLNPCEASYRRLGDRKAPIFVTWSRENRNQLLRIPSGKEGQRRIELRSPDPMTNPYLAYALLIYAGLDGITKSEEPGPAVNRYLSAEDTAEYDRLPLSLDEAKKIAGESEFIRKILPVDFIG